MYAHSATGDWQEFADEAVKLKWVDAVIGGCRETALVKSPDSIVPANFGTASISNSRTDGDPGNQEPGAKRGALLPRLNPIDCYYLYNPDAYYRTE